MWILYHDVLKPLTIQLHQKWPAEKMIYLLLSYFYPTYVKLRSTNTGFNLMIQQIPCSFIEQLCCVFHIVTINCLYAPLKIFINPKGASFEPFKIIIPLNGALVRGVPRDLPITLVLYIDVQILYSNNVNATYTVLYYIMQLPL